MLIPKPLPRKGTETSTPLALHTKVEAFDSKPLPRKGTETQIIKHVSVSTETVKDSKPLPRKGRKPFSVSG